MVFLSLALDMSWGVSRVRSRAVLRVSPARVIPDSITRGRLSNPVRGSAFVPFEIRGWTGVRFTSLGRIARGWPSNPCRGPAVVPSRVLNLDRSPFFSQKEPPRITPAVVGCVFLGDGRDAVRSWWTRATDWSGASDTRACAVKTGAVRYVH